MSLSQRELLQAADRIHDQLIQLHSARPGATLSKASWCDCCRLLEQLEVAQQRGWQVAARHLRQRLERSLRSLESQVQGAVKTLTELRLSERREVPSLRQVYEELVAIQDEFGAVDCSLADKTLSVVTDQVLLEEVDLGPFEIRLEWANLGDYAPYRVVAQEPYPAASNEAVLHPHVSDEVLCEGEGHRAIEAALEQGRLFDFFTLVDRILKTYNAGSAYVQLSRWSGQPCGDCGRLLDEDEEYGCDRCSEIQCRDCIIACERCGYYFCGQCAGRCGACQELCCIRCLDECQDCRKSICTECRFEGPRCEECHAQSETTNAPTETASAGEPATNHLPADNATSAPAPAEAGAAV